VAELNCSEHNKRSRVRVWATQAAHCPTDDAEQLTDLGLFTQVGQQTPPTMKMQPKVNSNQVWHQGLQNAVEDPCLERGYLSDAAADRFKGMPVMTPPACSESVQNRQGP